MESIRNTKGLDVLEKEARMANKRSLGTCEYLLRLLALELTLNGYYTSWSVKTDQICKNQQII